MSTVVITGANQGIGLALAQFYCERGAQVIAVCRSSSQELEALSCEIVSEIDISDGDTVVKLNEALQGKSVDILINNAGLFGDEVIGRLNFDNIAHLFSVNALGALRVTELVLPYMSNGAKIALITSRMGSIADNTSGGRYGYRMSKAALNIAGVSLAHDLRDRGIAVALLHPGFVKTAMVNFGGDITAQEAAKRLATRINELNLSNSGSFWHSNGEVLPW